MFKKKLTFMLIPHSMGISRQVRIPVAAIYLAVGGVMLLVFASFFLSAEFFADKVDARELARLRAENAALHRQFEQLKWNLTEVETRFSQLVDREVKIRSLFSLPEIDPAERQLGVGGPAPPSAAMMSNVQREATVTGQQIDRLLTLSSFELEKFNEVEDELLKLRDRLDHTPSIWPTNGWLSRGFGMKFDPFTGMKQMHRGLDIANRTGTKVIAPAAGRVKFVGQNGGMGNTVVIDHGYGFETRYAHLSDFRVKRGQRVERGDVVGLMGSTGYSTGPHLHYEVLRNGKHLDPRVFILNDNS
ncbi:MAG TPA: M23 family metallopeptidase [candidate division Zixibacteria bacterium]|nr:M23 family metallopeptidase [candidate division Zixibacteria bacterium]MDD4916620.1 M23 family metallopeptidase [candidate division Zixibacteria bacterium]MDM7974133.1 M23 family metallopeptidase [candidate division Zixibacteria bacterium]HOD65511.1 M23 family metallopeptidase [candidate division Zixibacteria bacterium]HOZ08749.1 M23 family metallopeptidase [candidate division Zixibacteria bacterium]